MYFPLVPWRVCLSLLLILDAARASHLTPSVADVLRKSQELIDTKRYEDAAALLERIRSEAVKQNDEYSEALILDRLGFTYEHEGRYVAARAAFDGSVSRLTRIEGRDAPDLIQPLTDLANLLYECNQNSQAEPLVRRNLAILAFSGPPDARTAGELAVLARIYLSEGKLPPAGKSAEESLNILRQIGHSDDLLASVAYSVLGAVYYERHDRKAAEQALSHAFTILQTHLTPGDYLLSEGLANLGLFYAGSGFRERGEPLLEQAWVSFRLNATNTTFVRNLLITWAEFERRWGNKDKSKDLMRQAKVLMATNPEELMSGDLVDANALQ